MAEEDKPRRSAMLLARNAEQVMVCLEKAIAPAAFRPR